MSPLQAALVYATFAGMTIPLGAFVARIEHIRPRWLETEFRHSVIAFGGGVLLAAIALVLVPEGTRHLSVWAQVTAFAAGGITFFAADRLIAKHGGTGAQLMAMLLDFVPESMALGAMLATNEAAGLLLALLIALQNFPEGFNAYRELKQADRHNAATILTAFCALVVLGPLAAWFGFSVLREMQQVLGVIMLFAAGGILYLTFEDIAPQAHLRRHWFPPLAAVAGFLLGLFGHAITQ